MPTNLDRYQKDLSDLIALGTELQHAIQYECHPKEFRAQLSRVIKQQASNPPTTDEECAAAIEEFLKKLPSFKVNYQSWYSEAQALIKQLLPDRLGDFARLYEKPKTRKSIGYENYRIEDYMQGLTVRDPFGKTRVDPSAAIPHFSQQLAILQSAERRLKSSLFDMRQLVQADLLDSELDASRELAKHKFLRAAGALAGVVLEKHLAQVCDNHSLKVTKARPAINDLNQLLKDSGVIDTQSWRFNQFLADVRNLCDHNKNVEPTEGQIKDLIDGVAKVTKTIF